MSFLIYPVGQPSIEQIPDSNGGGFLQGVTNEPGRIGGLPIGHNGLIHGGVAGAATMTVRLDLQLTNGDYIAISDSVTTSDTVFEIDPAIQAAVPIGGLVWLNFVSHAVVGQTFYYLRTS